MTDRTPIVSLRGIGVRYDGAEALRDADLDIYADDFLGVIGPNGGGKTTLMKVILGTVPHTGTVTLSPELFRNRERLIGYMPQLSEFDRAFPISLREVVLSGLQGKKGFWGGYTKQDRRKAEELLDASGLGAIASQPIGAVSGGQMQRVSIARAFLYDSNVILMDEPFTSLDIKLKSEIISLFKELWQSCRRTAVFVTHDVGEAVGIADRIIIINKGKTVKDLESRFAATVKNLKEA